MPGPSISSSISGPDAATITQVTSAEAEADVASPVDPGTLTVNDLGASYVQSSHWEAILLEVRGLKEDFISNSMAQTGGSSLFYGPSRHATRDEILAAVPTRSVVDRLMAVHFDYHLITPC